MRLSPCGAATCPPLATVAAPGSVAHLLVANGRLVVGTDAGLHAFGLPARAGRGRARSSPPEPL
jgi:hypothetical protein